MVHFVRILYSEVTNMANEKKKDFNAMLHDSKDMPKFQTITDQASIEKYGGGRMFFAPPIDYDAVMKSIPGERHSKRICWKLRDTLLFSKEG